MFKVRNPYVIAAAAGLAVGAPVLAQPAPPPSHLVDWRVDSGPVSWQGGAVHEARAVYSTVVTVPGAAWLRLAFSDVVLAGVIEEGSGSYLKITSLGDGAAQYLNAESAAQWANTSAYFNGESVLVELMAYPGTGQNRLAIVSATAGEPAGAAGADTICGTVDDRALSSDPRAARHMPEGCTSWLWNDTNRMFGTAGHCGVSSGDVQQFNVPLSTTGGGTVAPPPEDQYPVDAASIQFTNGGTGNDWAYFAAFPNSNTGLTAYQRQGQHYTVGATAPSSATTIRITGYGTVSSPVSPTWSQVQKTHTGPWASLATNLLRYSVDTTGGNSGSAVVDETGGGVVVGVHTHAGCTTSGGSNQGTAIHHAAWTAARGNPLGVARSGSGVVTGNLFAVGDAVNNFGTCNTSSGNFAKIMAAPPRMEGLAYDWNAGVFYGVSNDTYGVAPGAAGRKLWTIDPATGETAYVANITGTASVINGLGYNPATQTLYGIAQADGQLFSINRTTGAAVAIGSPGGGTVGALEFDPSSQLLLGIDDSGGASKLVSINTATGGRTLIGVLGAGIADCNGLAVTGDGLLWTINAANEQLLRVDRLSGAATVVGPTGGLFGASYGMSAVLPSLTMALATPIPALVPPGEGLTIDVAIVPGAQNVVEGSPKVWYRPAGTGEYVATPLQSLGDDLYRGSIPAQACEDTPQFYFSAEGDQGAQIRLPTGAPATVFSTLVGVMNTTMMIDESFESGLPAGWTATGLWNVGSACAPGGTCDGAGWAYYGQAGSCNYSTGASTNGLLTAPTVSLPTLPPDGEITLSFCSAKISENNPAYDRTTVLVNGVVVDTPGESAAFQAREVDLSSYAGQQVTIQFKFDSMDSINNNFRGWHVDHVRLAVLGATCEGGASSCYANCDGTTAEPFLNVADFTCFLQRFAAADSYANCDGSTEAPVLNVADFTCFLQKFAAGCSAP